jgi:hypothetical protein
LTKRSALGSRSRMKRTKRSRKTAKRVGKTARPAPSSACCALILLKTDRIRQADLKKFERSKRTFAELEAQHDRFEKTERRAYVQWVRLHCGSVMEDIRNTSEQCQMLVQTMQLANDFKTFYRLKTSRECILAAERYFAEGRPPPGFESFFAPEPSPSREEDPFAYGEESASEDDFADIFGDEDASDAEEYRAVEEMMRDFLGLPPLSPSPPRQVDQRQSLKEVYRKIARRLHPDQGGSGEQRQMELWYEAQQAYADHDLETLERILAHCDLLDDDAARTAPVSSIRAGIVFFKDACTRLRRKIRQLKKEPEWGFLAWSETRQNKERDAHLREFRRELHRVRSDLALWRRVRDRQVMTKPMRERALPKKRPARVDTRQMAFDL